MDNLIVIESEIFCWNRSGVLLINPATNSGVEVTALTSTDGNPGSSSGQAFTSNSTQSGLPGSEMTEVVLAQNVVPPHVLEHDDHQEQPVGNLAGSEQIAPQELMLNIISPYSVEQNDGIRSAERMLLSQPLPVEYVLEGLMQQNRQGNTSSLAVQQDGNTLRLSVHAVMANLDLSGFAGLFLRYNNGQFLNAGCYPIHGTIHALVFANACFLGIFLAREFARIRAQAGDGWEATLLILESDQFGLLQRVALPDIEGLTNELRQTRYCIVHVPYESNGAAVQLAEYAFENELEDPVVHPNLPGWVYEFFE